METYKKSLIDRLEKDRILSLEEYEALLSQPSEKLRAYAAKKASEVRRKIYGNKIYVRGLIEISNFCRNDCFYCGIRRSNEHCERYRLTREEILDCCEAGYQMGFRTFVLQSGEGAYPLEEICQLIREIKSRYSECAITLSLGEYPAEAYEKLRKAGADRYLLRQESINRDLYERLHPTDMSYQNRIRCLEDLKKFGYATGCGFMVGAPGQTLRHLAEELRFIGELEPDMCGIGPYLPQKDTPFADCRAGSAKLTIYLLSLIRLLVPSILLPATTALSTALPDGRERGILAGANVIMPNLSPQEICGKYILYDNKRYTETESADGMERLKKQMEQIGYRIVEDRGDRKHVSDEISESRRIYFS